MKTKSVNKSIEYWDIADIYKTKLDGTFGKLYLHIVATVNVGEGVEVQSMTYDSAPNDLQNQISQLGWTDSKLIIMAKVRFTGYPGNVRTIPTNHTKSIGKIEEPGGPNMTHVILVLEDYTENGRIRKMKRTSNAVTVMGIGWLSNHTFRDFKGHLNNQNQ